MTYHLHITSAAEKDMLMAANYIEFVLKNLKALDNLLDEAERQINALVQFPEKFTLVEDKLLASWGIRFTKVNNHLAFYVISEEETQVNIVRFLYAKSNWISTLKLGFSLI